ncbi:MAG: hypothetical protein B6244_11080 [Candidatus Cloacimonetes bacterium 4572_55]|nr:MAG: hypothetical protein B6244_11080 [Candidatus Cloacimonetes bacterium 4572_55]
MRWSRIFVFTTVLIFLSASLIGTSFAKKDGAKKKSSWNFIKEISDGDPVVALVKGKKRTYYELKSNYKSSFTLEGPMQVLIRTRLVMPHDEKSKRSYKIIFKDENKKEHSFTETTHRAVRVKLPGKKSAVGSSMIYQFDVPAGKHTYYFKTTGNAKVLARFYQRQMKKKIVWHPLEISTGEEVFIIQKSKAYKYYMTGKDQLVVFTVTGPTKLKILSRLNFTSSMVGSQRYTLTVEEDGKKKDSPFATVKSKKNVYSEHKDIVPGVAKTLIIEAPAGRHEYRIKFSGKENVSGAIRVLKAE